MGRPKHALKVPRLFIFYFLKFGGGVGFYFYFSLVPNVFPLCSLYVSQTIIGLLAQVENGDKQENSECIPLLNNKMRSRGGLFFFFVWGPRGGGVKIKEFTSF